MKKDREKFLSSIYVIIKNEDNKILLQRRQGTKLWHGYLVLTAWHLDIRDNVYDILPHNYLSPTSEILSRSYNDIVDTFVVNRRNRTLLPHFDVCF